MKTKRMSAVSTAALMAHVPAAVQGGVRNEVDVESLLKQVNQKLDQVNGEVKQTAEEALKQARRSGDVSAETKATADQLLSAQNSLKSAVDGLTEKLEGTAERLAEVSQAVALGTGGRGAARQTLGQAVVSEADRLKAFRSGNAGASLTITVQNAITSVDGSAGGLTYQEEEREPIRMARRRLLIRNLIGQGRVGSDLIKYRKQTTRTNAAAAIAEQGTYPESAFGWTKATAEVKKIGHHINISEESLADADQLQSEIDGELRYGIELEVENQILAGDGLGENLSGLIPNATAFVAAAGLPNVTRIDRLRLALLQVVLADYIPTGIVLNPTDWAGIDLLKDSQGRFVFGNPGVQTTPTLWGKDVVESNSMTAGEWLVGDMRMAATLYERSEVEVLISSEHGDNFIEGMLTMRGRERLALAVKRSAALVTGDFS